MLNPEAAPVEDDQLPEGSDEPTEPQEEAEEVAPEAEAEAEPEATAEEESDELVITLGDEPPPRLTPPKTPRLFARCGSACGS